MAASSGGKPKPKAAAYSSCAGSKVLASGSEACAVPDRECVVLDRLGIDSYVLTNIFTNEQSDVLKGTDWQFEDDLDSGRAAVFRGPTEQHPDGQVHVVEDLFKKHVFRTMDGELWV